MLEATWYSWRKQRIILTSRRVGDYNTSSEVQQVCPRRWRGPEETMVCVYDINRITSIVYQCWLHLNPNVNDLENLSIGLMLYSEILQWNFTSKDRQFGYPSSTWAVKFYSQNHNIAWDNKPIFSLPERILIYMSHFSYACKTEGENGISCLISETA